MRAWFRGEFRGGSVPRLELGQSLGAFARQDGGISPLFVFFEVANVSEESISVAAVRVSPKGVAGTALSDARDGSLEGDLPPRTLKPGESARFRVLAKTLAGTARDAGYGGRPRLEIVAEELAGASIARASGSGWTSTCG